MDIREATDVDEAEKRIRQAAARATETAVRELREAHSALGDLAEPLKSLVKDAASIAVAEFTVPERAPGAVADNRQSWFEFRPNDFDRIDGLAGRALGAGKYRILVAVLPIGAKPDPSVEDRGLRVAIPKPTFR